jgi:hypothetical protein
VTGAACRLILRLYPRSFRAAWGSELERVAAEAVRAARPRGAAAVLRARAWVLWDALRILPGAWADARQDALRREGTALRSTGLEGGRRRLFAAALDALRQDVR